MAEHHGCVETPRTVPGQGFKFSAVVAMVAARSPADRPIRVWRSSVARAAEFAPAHGACGRREPVAIPGSSWRPAIAPPRAFSARSKPAPAWVVREWHSASSPGAPKRIGGRWGAPGREAGRARAARPPPGGSGAHRRAAVATPGRPPQCATASEGSACAAEPGRRPRPTGRRDRVRGRRTWEDTGSQGSVDPPDPCKELVRVLQRPGALAEATSTGAHGLSDCAASDDMGAPSEVPGLQTARRVAGAPPRAQGRSGREGTPPRAAGEMPPSVETQPVRCAGASEVEMDPGEGLRGHLCASCGVVRWLPFEALEPGGGFVCAITGLQCEDGVVQAMASGDGEEDGAELLDDDGGELFAVVCVHCGERRLLPFQIGKPFACRDVALSCATRHEMDGECGAESGTDTLAHLRSDDGLTTPSVDDDELVFQACAHCGIERALPRGLAGVLGAFSCGELGLECVVTGALACEQGAEASGQSRHSDHERLRTQLQWKVLIYDMTAADAARLFRDHGLDPPSPEALRDLRTSTLASLRKKLGADRREVKTALKCANRKGPVKRFLHNELVTVSKKDKYMREEKESAEDRAKTSVELYVLGIGRGGRHAIKLAREEKHRGPRSHK